MLPEDYKLRCDKHSLGTNEYCELCWLRNEVFYAVETARKDTRSLLASTHLAISVLNDCFNKIEKQIVNLNEQVQELRNK